jgi:hypothetical protein
VLLIVLLGVAYVLVVKAPIYQAKSSYVLLPPPTPTPDQVTHDPALKGVKWNNPFAGYGNLSTVIDLLTQVLTSPAERQMLKKQGVTGSYTVASLTTASGNEPIVQITAEGPSAAVATKSAVLVGKAFNTQLANIQASQGTRKQYWIGSLELSRPDRAEEQESSKLRDLIGVIAIGVILLFVVVSTMNAREERKRQRLSAQAGMEEAEPGAVRVAEPESNGHPVESYAAEPERARAAGLFRPAPEPGDGWLEFEEDWKQSRP